MLINCTTQEYLVNIGLDSHFNMPPLRVADQPNTWTIIGGRSVQHPRGGSDTMLKSNGPNSISKDTLRDEDCLWLINYTTQEYLVNVGLDSHFNT
jgi:hypothetical protein